MKLLLLLFILMQGFTGDEPDCKAFYEKTLYSIAIKGDLIKKEKTDEYYLLYVKNEEDGGKELVVRLLKNQTGKSIFIFASDKSLISKRKGETALHVLAPMNGGFNGRIFPDLCE